MKSVPKLIRHFANILILSAMLVIALNILLLYIFTSSQIPNGSPWTLADKTAKTLKYHKNGYTLSLSTEKELEKYNVWAFYIDNNTMQVTWHTKNLPETIPLSYTISGISNLTRGYINEYPTFTGECKNGLVVLGFPKESFWKHMYPSWDMDLIEKLPLRILQVIFANILLLLVIYITANIKLLKSVKPVTNGIQALPEGNPVYIKEKGLFSELAASINKTSEILQSQKYHLHKKETARANWIAGVSHDIRTPLSIVMGYAGQLKEDTDLSIEAQNKADVILKQGRRIKNLVNDLNLASKLEYNMQPLNLARQNLVAITRQVVVDFINMDTLNRHQIEWETDKNLSTCLVNADKELIKRAISNLIWNSINHNETGCTIFVKATSLNNTCSVEVSDNGKGASDGEIERLNNTPHYMVCDKNIKGQRHGLGLLIVKQIAAAHGGTVNIGHGRHGGFYVKFTLPLSE
ncbi:MAG: HAMP domain-containing histidine kinase [Lachnospiraceae bacterium]